MYITHEKEEGKEPLTNEVFPFTSSRERHDQVNPSAQENKGGA